MRNFCFTSVLYVAKLFDNLRTYHICKQQQFRFITSFSCKEWKLKTKSCTMWNEKKKRNINKSKVSQSMLMKSRANKKNKKINVMMWHNDIRQNANYEWAIFENFYTIDISINFGTFPDDVVKDCLHQIALQISMDKKWNFLFS